MNEFQFDIVIPSQVKLRKNLRDGDQRFNKTTKMYEYWDASKQSWIPTLGGGGTEGGGYITRAEFDSHKVDPSGHPIATTDNAGFIDNLSVAKLKEVETVLSPDPATLFDSILK